MTKIAFQSLRFLLILFALAHLSSVILSYTVYSHQFAPSLPNPVSTPVNWWSGLIMTILLVVMGVLLAIRLQTGSYHIFLAAFLILFAYSFTPEQGWWWLPGFDTWMPTIFTPFTGAVFIYSMMRFSGKRDISEYRNYFMKRYRPKYYKRIIIFFSGDKPFWLILFPVMLLLALGDLLFSRYIGGCLNLLILILGLIYFRISYFFSGRENQNRMGWLLWGLVTVIGFYFAEMFLWLFYPDYTTLIIVLYLTKLLVICISFALSIFFFKSTDARFVVRKTLIYGAILLAGLFLFGAVEHYVIHVIAHSLHIESSILNSCLGAAIALLIRPLHHKVEHWLGHWEKKKKKINTEHLDVQSGTQLS